MRRSSRRRSVRSVEGALVTRTAANANLVRETSASNRILQSSSFEVLTEKRRNYQGKRFLSAEDDELINQFLSLPITRDPYLCIGEKWINAWQIRDVLFKLELEDDALDIYFGILEDEQSPTKWYYVSSWAQKTLKDSHPLLEDAVSVESYMNTLTGFFRGCTTTTLMDLDMVQWLKMYFRLHHFISNVEDWPIIRDDQCPQQSNGVDCGMFVLKYGEHLIKGTDMNFEQKDIPRFRGEYAVKVIRKAKESESRIKKIQEDKDKRWAENLDSDVLTRYRYDII
ncbi:putative ubiquitin-like-specific protease 1B [Acorus calamus]|uniref:Ubiquitin-like-specific protease 1B n=1 Tax=Acorus calamus TaxID=4465 RepID=A0AAV9DHR0_ACOCL|nr:putative ubiquitin-like-specific protease 1B [Acorus calamus]